MKGYMALSIGYIVLVFIFGGALSSEYSELFYLDPITNTAMSAKQYAATYLNPTPLIEYENIQT
jgi:hypothetical protein